MGSIKGVPHPFPYQGSKRQLASYIMRCLPAHTNRLVEPFAGSAAVTIAAAQLRRAKRFHINDINAPLMSLWQAIVERPEKLADEYQSLWEQQRGRERAFFDEVRERFNAHHQPHCFLYLLARCVKAAIRYNGKGEFNNSPDNRRLGMHPDSMRANILCTSALLQGKILITCVDYRQVLSGVKRDDVIYMDPPYQGVCQPRDHRYVRGVRHEDFVESLEELNRRGISYIVSYDGRTGEKVFGAPLPSHLGLAHHEVAAGRSTQATLLGRDHETVESIYLSAALLQRLESAPRLHKTPSPMLFEAV